jgi:uncharacterized protein (DUF433 family)
MANDEPHTLLGKGIYTPRQAARFANVSTAKMRRWIHGTRAGEAAVRAQLAGDEDLFVTFVDFVQALTVSEIRRELDMPLQKIRQFVDGAAKDYGVTFPFARQHKLYTFDGEIVLELPQSGKLIEMTGRSRGNQLMRPIFEQYATDLKYDPESHLASKYTVYACETGRVVMDPDIRFGAPLVEGCGVTVDVLVNAVRSEGSLKAAADVHEVSEDDVDVALRCNRWRFNNAA